MNDYPIKTIEKDNVIVKLCTENLNKLRNKFISILASTYDKIANRFDDWYDPDSGEYLINSKGVAKCNGDEFDPEVGKEIAFRKVKLSANIKKLHVIDSAIRAQLQGASEMFEIRKKILKYIQKDIEALKEYNPSYEPNL
jgi:predicted ATP-grasp superfamily ATP-dependent carboligase